MVYIRKKVEDRVRGSQKHQMCGREAQNKNSNQNIPINMCEIFLQSQECYMHEVSV